MPAIYLESACGIMHGVGSKYMPLETNRCMLLICHPTFSQYECTDRYTVSTSYLGGRLLLAP